MQYTQQDFFSAVLSTSGLPCIAYKRPTAKGMQHKVFENVVELATYVDTVDAATHDYYFCISTLLAPSIRDRGQDRVRTQTNASHTRCFVLDIDIHEDDERFYSTQQEGRDGVISICESLGLPDPIIVNSGYGLHVYWPMMAGIPSVEWKLTAERFKKVLSLIAPLAVGDGSRVADSAGVLRVPGTLNLKRGDSAPVEIEQWFSDYIDLGEFQASLKAMGAPEAPVGTVKKKPLVSLDIERANLPPVELKALVRNCNWTAEYLKHADTATEPEWYAMLGVLPYVVHTKDDGTVVKGEALAQLFSQKHPGYTAANTRAKYRQVATGQTGPTTCERMHALNPDRCAGCPFWQAVTSPINAARLARPSIVPAVVTTEVMTPDGERVVESVLIPLPPKPYFRGENGGIYLRSKEQNDDGSWGESIIRVYDYDMYPVRRFRTEAIETETLEVKLHLPHDGMRTFKMPTEYLADQKKLNIFLASHGVIAEANKSKWLVKYMIDYVRDMQMNGAAEVEFSRFGWRDINSDNPKFVVGNGYISKGAPLISGSYAYFLKEAAKAVATTGSLDLWKEAFSVYTQVPDSEPYQLCALLGFAAPLLALTEYSGVLYNMVGSSGAGKSTALKIMSSVWGQPSDRHVKPVDNEIPVFNFIGYLNSVPVAFDELTKMEGDKLARFILNFTGGRGKMRATRNGSNALNEVEWDTIVAGTSNTSLYEKLAQERKGYSAEAMRIFEVPVPRSNEQYKPVMTGAVEVLRENYGMAGRAYMEYLLPRLHAAREGVARSMARIDQIGGRSPDERFWVALLACVEIGGAISGKLGLHTYDIPALVRWCLTNTVEAKAQVESTHSTPVTCLSEFFNSTLDGTLSFRDNVCDMSAMGTNLRTIKTRLEYTGQTPTVAFISVAALRTFCSRNKVDFAWLRRGLMEASIIVDANCTKRLASGTSLPNVPTRAWQINMTHPLMVAAFTVPHPAKEG